METAKELYAQALADIVREGTEMSAREELAKALGIEESESGFIVARRDGWVIEVWLMLFNWRLVAYRDDDRLSVVHGFCYFGRGVDALSRAVVAGKDWMDPINQKPEGFDKQAF